MPHSGTTRRPLFWLVLLFVALYGLDLAVHRDLWAQDEARYGEVVREMLADGTWLIPHLNGHPYPDKPPVYFWLVAAVGAVVGHGEFAFRLVSVAATLIAALGVHAVARRLADESTAFWSAALFLTCLATLTVGHIVRMDMPLTAASVWAWAALLDRRAAGSTASLAGFWGATALTIAFKGPIGLLFTVVPATLWLVWVDRRAVLRTLRPISGLLLLAALVGGWITAVVVLGQGAYLERIWNEQLVGRAVKSWSHREPFWFYFALMPLLLMPWTGLVVSGMRARHPEWRVLTCFTLAPLVALSLVSGKLFIYVEPMIPGLAIFGGLAAARLASAVRVPATQVWWPVAYVALLAGVAGWGAANQPGLEANRAWMASAVLVVAALVGVALTRVDGRRWLVGWLTASVAVNAGVFVLLSQALGPVFSPRALGEYVAQVAGPDRPVGVVHSTRGILNVYAQRRFEELTLDNAGAWFRAHSDAILIVQQPHVGRVVPEASSCAIDGRFSVEMKEYRVLGSCSR